MKRGLITSYMAGLQDTVNGERYGKIFRYFFPEFITSLVLYSMPFLLEAYFVGQLKSTPTYATLGATSILIHLLIKIGEGLSVGTVVLSGQFNGRGEYKEAGRCLCDAFWLTCSLGALISFFLYTCAYYIYYWFDVPREIISLGTPFLRLRAVSIFFMFGSLAFIGFLRGIKNTKTPMKIFITGAAVLLFFDYVLINGNLGFPKMGLQGSAWASLFQYVFMFVIALVSIINNKKYKKYSIALFSPFQGKSYMKRLLFLSLPVLLDKSVFAISLIWLCKMIAPMGTSSLATFNVVKDMERFAFVPAIACAQVITFLVSNDYSIGMWESIKSNIKKVIFLASCMVFLLLLLFSLKPEYVIQLFDKNGDFTQTAARAFPILSILVFFDLLQLILSGALRGAANVKTVMKTRIFVCFGYFVPVSYMLSHMPMQNHLVKFLLIYGSFYFGSALMSVVYINHFRSDKWKPQSS